jgi:capsular polysaccharide transport system permease protein
MGGQRSLRYGVVVSEAGSDMTESLPLPSRSAGARTLSNVAAHVRVIQALVIRDLMVRFGRRHLGFVWAVLEPMMLTAGVMVVWSLLREPTLHGISMVLFVFSGYLPLTLWRHITNASLKLFQRNLGLLYHQPIPLADILVARWLLEFLSSTVALLVIYFIVAATGVVALPEAPHLMLAGWLFMAWFAGSAAMLMVTWTEYWEPAEKLFQPAQYLMLPVSGVFFMVDWLPTHGGQLALLNPMVHCFELFRAGIFGEEVVTHYDVWYLASWCIGLTIAGCAAMSRIRPHIQIG